MPDARVPGQPARGTARSAQPQLTGGVGVQQVAFQYAFFDHHGAPRRNAFVIERGCAKESGYGAVVDDGDVLGCDAFPQLARQEGGFAVDCVALDGFEYITNQCAGGERLEDYGNFLGGDFACPQALQGSLGGPASNGGW